MFKLLGSSKKVVGTATNRVPQVWDRKTVYIEGDNFAEYMRRDNGRYLSQVIKNMRKDKPIKVRKGDDENFVTLKKVSLDSNRKHDVVIEVSENLDFVSTLGFIGIVSAILSQGMSVVVDFGIRKRFHRIENANRLRAVDLLDSSVSKIATSFSKLAIEQVQAMPSNRINIQDVLSATDRLRQGIASCIVDTDYSPNGIRNHICVRIEDKAGGLDWINMLTKALRDSK